MQVGREASKEKSVAYLREAGARLVRVVGRFEVGGKAGEFVDGGSLSDQCVVIGPIDLGERANKISIKLDTGRNAGILGMRRKAKEHEEHRGILSDQAGVRLLKP